MSIVRNGAPAIVYLQTPNPDFAGFTIFQNMAPGRLTKDIRMTGNAGYPLTSSWTGVPLGVTALHTRTLLEYSLGTDFVINGPDYDVVYLTCVSNWGTGSSPNVGMKQMFVQADGASAIGLSIPYAAPTTSLFSYITHADQSATSVYYASTGIYSNALTEVPSIGSLNAFDINLGTVGTIGALAPNGMYKGRCGSWVCSPFTGETLVNPAAGEAGWFAVRYHKQTGDGVYRVSFTTSLFNAGTTIKTVSITPQGSRRELGTPCSSSRDLNNTVRGEMILAWDIDAAGDDWVALVKEQGDIWKDSVAQSTRISRTLNTKLGNYVIQNPNFITNLTNTNSEKCLGSLTAGSTILIEGGIFSTTGTPPLSAGNLSSLGTDTPNNVNSVGYGVFLENAGATISVRQPVIVWGDQVNGSNGNPIGISTTNAGSIIFKLDTGAIGPNLSGCKLVVRNPSKSFVPPAVSGTFEYTFNISPVGINGGVYESYPFSIGSGSSSGMSSNSFNAKSWGQ